MNQNTILWTILTFWNTDDTFEIGINFLKKRKNFEGTPIQKKKQRENK